MTTEFAQPDRGFEASYHGGCDECEERIAPGDRIEYRDGWVVHVDCPTPRPRTPARICGRCWLEVPAGGDCGC